MRQRKFKFPEEKISPQFAARLDRLGPQQKVRAIVLLGVQNTEQGSTKRQSLTERQAAIEATRRSAGQALGDIDDILARFGGQRLAEMPDALGSLPVETTAAGISALAASEKVKAILEDQGIFLLR